MCNTLPFWIEMGTDEENISPKQIDDIRREYILPVECLTAAIGLNYVAYGNGIKTKTFSPKSLKIHIFAKCEMRNIRKFLLKRERFAKHLAKIGN